jgi:hypothetical protein
MRRPDLLLLVVCLTGSSKLAAQAPGESGSFVVRHAGDTVAIETFARTDTKLEGTLALRNSKHTSERYTAVIGPDATLPLIELTVSEGADSGALKAKVVQRARVIFKEDSAAVDDVSKAGLVTRVFGTSVGAIPYLNLSFALLEQALRRAQAKQESPVSFFNLGGGQTITAKVSPLGSDSLRVDIGNVQFHLRMGRDSRILGGRITGQDVTVDRH